MEGGIVSQLDKVLVPRILEVNLLGVIADTTTEQQTEIEQCGETLNHGVALALADPI